MSYQYQRKKAKKLARRSRAKEILVERWTPTARAVTTITARRAGWFSPTEDHYAAGMLGLMKAIIRYDGIQGAAFSTHVWNCVRYEVLNEIRGATWFPTHGSRGDKKLPDGRMTSLDAMNIPEDAGDRDKSNQQKHSARSLTRETADALAQFDKHSEEIDLHESLWRAIDKLPPEMYEIIVEGEFHGVPQKELAKNRGVSQSAISQMKEVALKTLKEMLEKERW